MYVFLCTCVHLPVSVSASLACWPVCGSVYMSAVHTRMCMYLCESVHLCLCICVNMCWYMHLSVYIQGWSHVLVYTYVHVCSSAGWKHVQTSCVPQPPRATESLSPQLFWSSCTKYSFYSTASCVSKHPTTQSQSWWVQQKCSGGWPWGTNFSGRT